MMRSYPDLGETVYEQRLSSGLLVRVVKKLDFAKKHAFLAVNYGAMDSLFSVDGLEFVSPQGVAHYLEHKMFDMPDENVMQRFSQLGANPNAFTSYDMTAYYVECTEHFRENLELLLHFVSTPYFTRDSVEKERGIIAQEIRMYEDNPDSRLYEDLYSALYAHHPIRHSIAGTVESIGEITEQTLYDCYHGFYTPSNMMLCVVGDVDPEQVFNLADMAFPKQNLVACTRNYGRPEEMKPAVARTERKMEVSMPMFSIGFKTEPAAYGRDSMLQEITGELAAEILMGESSSLYTRIYEKDLIDSSFACGYEGVKGMSILVASGDSRDPQAVCDAVLAEAERIARNGIDETLFRRLKKSALGRRIRDLDGFDSICYRMCAYHFEGVDYLSFPEIFSDVTVERVAEFLKRTVTSERIALSAIIPKQ